jgi:hypothetical protein
MSPAPESFVGWGQRVGHARRAARALGVGFLSGGYGQEELDSRALDQDGNIRDISASRRGDKAAIERFFHERLKGLRYILRGIITEHSTRQYSIHASLDTCKAGVLRWTRCK